MKRRGIYLSLLLLLCFSHAHSQEITNKGQTYFPEGSINIRANLIPWMTLIPALGIEYKPTENIGVIVDGAFAHWDWDNDERHHRFWIVNPQVRYYTGELKGSYIGIEGKIGQYNFKWNGNNKEGDQGKFMSGGFTLGHQFDCGKNLLVDLGVSLGYLYLYDKQEYARIENNDYHIGDKRANGYWGPTGASITFVWKINN